VRADVTAVILAGGAGRRMGGAIKPLLEVDGRRILDRQLAVLRPRVGAVVVSANDAAWSPVPVIADPVVDGGPLAGLAAGLAAATTPWILAVAGDMPWLAGAVIDRILATADGEIDGAVVPRVGGFPEPLLAAYHVRALPAITAALARGERSPSRLIERGELAVRWIEEAALRELDAELRSFASVNEPSDLR
jgi:molybdopterin-guanine dinucleotide biosynthesis protein A